MKLLLAFAFAFAFVSVANADDGGSYFQNCRSHTWVSDEGKTPNGWTAQATDGCHKVEWTSSIGPSACSGSVTFNVTDKVDPWEGDLPNTGNYCEMRAAHEANLYFLNLFKVPTGTSVTVRYQGN